MCTKSVRGALPSYTHHNKYLSLETNSIVLPFDHRVCFFTENPQEVKRSAIFTQERSQEGEKHVQNIICSQTQLDSIVHEQTIICRQLFAGHVVGSQPMKRKNNLLQMITTFNSHKYRIYIVLPATTLASNPQIPWCGLRILWLGDMSTAFLTRLLPPFTTKLTTSTKSRKVFTFFFFYWFCLAGHLGLKRNIEKKQANSCCN